MQVSRNRATFHGRPAVDTPGPADADAITPVADPRGSRAFRPRAASPAAPAGAAPELWALASMPTDAGTLRSVLVQARLATYAYARSPEALPGNWVPSEQLAIRARRRLGLDKQQGVLAGFGSLVDKHSGLVASVLVDADARSITVAFGGTTTGRSNASLEKRLRPNAREIAHQGWSALNAQFGRLTTSYRQAAEVVACIQEQIENDATWQGYGLSVTGHSQGGAEAIYAALMAPTPVPAVVFSPHVTIALVDAVRARPVAAASARDLVQVYTVGIDPILALRRMPGRRAGGIGTDFVIPADPRVTRHRLGAHIDYLDNLQALLDAAEAVTPPAAPSGPTPVPAGPHRSA